SSLRLPGALHRLFCFKEKLRCLVHPLDQLSRHAVSREEKKADLAQGLIESHHDPPPRLGGAFVERAEINRRDRLQNPTHFTLPARRAGASGKAVGYPSGVMQTSLRPSIPRISLISRSRTRMASVHVVPRPASYAAKKRFWSATVALSTSSVPSGS